MRYAVQLLLVIITSTVLWAAEPGVEKAEQWYKAELALIDVTLTTEQGEQTYLYLNSRGDATVRVNGQERKGKLQLKKDKVVAAFVAYIYSLPSDKMTETKTSAHIQRRIGKDSEHFIRYFASADEAKALRTHLDAVAKNVK
jgi:hypothetical protein